MKKLSILFALCCLASSLLFSSFSFGQEALPKPGEVIDKTNYQKYKHLFPPEFLAGFENSWGGIFSSPISMKVTETKSAPVPKTFQDLSAKNRGKYTIDKNGLIAGGYNYEGFPFPDVSPGDKDFATKLMWNWDYKYSFDDYVEIVHMYFQRRGEASSRSDAELKWISFINRMVDAPKPAYKTPTDLLKAMTQRYLYPDILRNQVILQWKYLEPTKSNDMYIYLPTMRRILRGEAGQRSTPLPGSILSPDDQHLFEGKTYEFTYKFVGEQKVLAILDNEINTKRDMHWNKPGLPWPTENWQVRDVYVIDVIAKDSKYPQSKKRLYLDKENIGNGFYSVIFDRAGQLWKIFNEAMTTMPMPGGEHSHWTGGELGVDLQLGTCQYGFWPSQKLNGNGLKYYDFTPPAILMLGR